MRIRPLLVPMFLSLLVLGCDCCDKSILLRYDAGRDEFSYLVVYQRIRSRTDADNGAQQPGPLELDYLADLYRNRDHIIPDPEIPLLGFGGTGSGILRFDAHKFAVVPLDKRPESLDIAETTADLARIDNRPGQLFLRDGAVGYYHQVIVPGAVADQVLAQLRKTDVSDAVAEEIEKEQERRRKGEAPPGWRLVQKAVLDDVRREMRQRVAGADDAGGGDGGDESVDRLPLSDESLAMILKAIEKGPMITRDKSALVLRVPMTPADAEEAYTLIDDALNLARRELGRVERNDLEKEKRQYDAISVVKPKDGVLEVRLDLPMYYSALAHPLDALPELEPAAARAADQTARALGAMLEVRQDVRLEQVIAQFNGGKLAGSGAENKGKPGEGIIKGK